MSNEIPTIKINKQDFIWHTSSDHSTSTKSPFDLLFETTWKEAEKKKVFSYDIKNVCTKTLDGCYKLVVQLNPMRRMNRRKPECLLSIKQTFDPQKFNFTMIKNEENLFTFVVKSLMNASKEEDMISAEGDELVSTMIVNNAPITDFHSLILPSPSHSKPQVLDFEGLLLGISAVLASNAPSLKIGFNSLGAMASVNHYHLHAYYLFHPLYIETAVCQKVVGPVYIFKNDDYAPGFIFQLENQDVENLVRNAEKLIKYLLEEEICHNIMITRGCRNVTDRKKVRFYDTVRVCIWARKPSYGTKDITQFVPALCELAGHIPVYDEESWETITESFVKKVMQEACLEVFTNLLPRVRLLFS